MTEEQIYEVFDSVKADLPELFDAKKAFADVKVDMNNLEEELAKNPSRIAFHSHQYARWEGLADHKKLQREARSAQNYNQLVKDNGKAPTAVALDAFNNADEEYTKYAKALAVAREQAESYKGILSALDKKQSSITHLNNRYLKESGLGGVSYQGSVEGDLVAKRAGVVAKVS
jgi:predicted  nucleic acid-binding Zn-ribbon protein